MDDDFAVWLRRQIEADLSKWRGLAAAYLPNVEREGEVLYFDALERVADHEAKLAILDEHRQGDKGSVWCSRCDPDSDMYTSTIVFYPCRTVRLLGSAYRHRLGYREEWKP